MKNLTQVVQSFSIRSKENRRSKNKQWMFEQVQFTTVNDGQTRTQQQIKVQLPQSIEQKKIQGGFVSHWSCGSPSPTKTPSTPPQQQQHHQTVTPTKSPTTGQFFPTSPMTNTTSSPRVTMTTPTSPPTYPPVQHHIHQSDTSSNSVNNNNFVSNPDLSQQLQRNQRQLQQQEEHLYQSMYLTLTGKYNKTTSNGCSNKIQKRSNSSNRTRVAITIRDLLN